MWLFIEKRKKLVETMRLRLDRSAVWFCYFTFHWPSARWYSPVRGNQNSLTFESRPKPLKTLNSLIFFVGSSIVYFSIQLFAYKTHNFIMCLIGSLNGFLVRQVFNKNMFQPIFHIMTERKCYCPKHFYIARHRHHARKVQWLGARHTLEIMQHVHAVQQK